MTKKLGLLVIHGIGTTKPDYDVAFKKKLFARLKKIGKDPEEIAYARVFWSKYIDERQEQFYRDVYSVKSNKLKWQLWNGARKFVINNLSDASSYRRKYAAENRNYTGIIREIHSAVRVIKQGLGDDDKPLIVAAHSLGCYVISNYIWDAHKIYAGENVDWNTTIQPQGKFELMITLSGMITFGCNIPLFVIGTDPIEPIRFPHPDIPAALKSKTRWDNYFDPTDILGWPLKQIKYSFDGKVKPADKLSYSDAVNADHAVAVGRWKFGLGFTPFSHVLYWTSPKLINPTAAALAKFL